MTKRAPGAAPERLAKLLESWKVIALAVVGVLLIGVRFETWQSNLAHADDVAALTGRTSQVESSMRELKQDLHLIRAQLVEIALTVGARQINNPPTRGVSP